MVDSRYSIPQLYDLAVQAGWNPKVAPYAAATAWVESHGDPTAASGTGPVGLMQINRANAQKLGYSLDDRLDPLKNMKMALQLWTNRGGENVSQQQGFADWWPYDRNTAQKDQQFQDALTQAEKGGANGVATGGIIGDIGNAISDLNPLAGIGQLASQFANFAKMAAWFVNPANDIRVLLGFFGIGFLLAGMWMLGREVRSG